MYLCFQGKWTAKKYWWFGFFYWLHTSKLFCLLLVCVCVCVCDVTCVCVSMPQFLCSVKEPLWGAGSSPVPWVSGFVLSQVCTVSAITCWVISLGNGLHMFYSCISLEISYCFELVSISLMKQWLIRICCNYWAYFPNPTICKTNFFFVCLLDFSFFGNRVSLSSPD